MTEQDIIQSAIEELYEMDKSKEAAAILDRSADPETRNLADECRALPSASEDLMAQVNFRKKLEEYLRTRRLPPVSRGLGAQVDFRKMLEEHIRKMKP